MTNIAKNRLKSTWTPLNNAEANTKIFEERRALVGKWFEKWTDEQRRSVLADLVGQCKVKQLEFAGDIISRKRPMHKDDFTRCLPRVVSLYILCHLDPRSLCRAAQVCWYWKHLTDADQIWMPKAVRLGWLLSFVPSQFEVGAWKRLYIENILTLKCMVPKQPQGVSLHDIDKLRLDSHRQGAPLLSGRPATAKSSDRPPWRGSDPTPKDTWRNNYLENDDEAKKVAKLRQKHIYGPVAEEIMRKAKNRVQAGQNKTSLTRELMSRSRSGPDGFNGWNSGLMPGERPDWAKTGTTSHAPFEISTDPSPFTDAAIRPGPVQPYVKPMARSSPQMSRRKSPVRSARDPPSTELFPSKGWQIPDREEDSDN